MKTKAALLTWPGPAALATIQLVGPESLSVLRCCFRPQAAQAATDLSGARPRFGAIRDGREILDQVIVAADAVRQTVEIHCHGGPRVVQRLLLLLQKQGVEITTWQQLRPADSIAAEVEFSLPSARTRLGVRAIAVQYPGGLTACLQGQIARLQNGDLTPDGLRNELRDRLAGFALARRLLQPASVVLAGPANTGKSTLANALTGKRQSITADAAGTTRDWTAHLTDINGLPVELVDTAGRRDRPDAIETHALQLAETRIARADLVVLVVEAGPRRDGQIEQERAILPENKEILVAVNKIDLYPDQSAGTSQTAPPADCVYISARHETNLDHLRSAIAGRLGLDRFDPQGPLVFTRRQYDLLAEIVNHPAALPDVIRKLQQVIG
ncbi:MAG: 50S ribosome-binding GTPase [Sedimentisphaerales bacterium]|nr:50S ribosome-binding GTPase [Sedimentisphaerales bacterium]